MKKIRAWIIMGAACMAVILSLPEDYGAVMSYAGAGLMQFLWNLIPVFLCVGLMDVWVEKEKMIKIIGQGPFTVHGHADRRADLCIAANRRPAHKKGRQDFQRTDFFMLQCQHPDSAVAV